MQRWPRSPCGPDGGERERTIEHRFDLAKDQRDEHIRRYDELLAAKLKAVYLAKCKTASRQLLREPKFARARKSNRPHSAVDDRECDENFDLEYDYRDQPIPDYDSEPR